MGKYTINETKVSNVVAQNGMSLEINDKDNTVQIRINGDIVSGGTSWANIIQASKMLGRLRPKSRFVCDVHGNYAVGTGLVQHESCPACIDNVIIDAQNNLAEANLEEEDG